MARGGGGGGRGGRGGRGSSGSGVEISLFTLFVSMKPVQRIISVCVVGLLMLLSAFMRTQDSAGAHDERPLEDFASAQYEQAFRYSAAYEDNLLLAFVVYEDCSDFSYMTWVGDHVCDDAFRNLRGEGTWLDAMLERRIGTDYTYSLSADLCGAIGELAEQINTDSGPDPLTCAEDHTDSPTYVLNMSRIDINGDELNEALADFRRKTQLPIVLVVEDAGDIFG